MPTNHPAKSIEKFLKNIILPIVGSDSPEERLRQRLIDGIGAMQWKLLGLFPVMAASGADITRSSIGRY